MPENEKPLQTVADFLTCINDLGPEVAERWQDVVWFLKKAEASVSDTKRERLLRAAVLTAAAAFEAYTNFLADRITQVGEVRGRRPTEFEMDCLREKHSVLENGKVQKKRKLYSAKERFLLLHNLLSGGRELPKEVGLRLGESFDVRDELVHPKPSFATTLLENNRGVDAVGGFLGADFVLSALWRGEDLKATAPRGFEWLVQA